jgi:hypothetical protein
MNDPQDERSHVKRPTSEIPRRGYERKRDATGTLRPPTQNLESPQPAYGPRPGTPPPPRRGRGGRRAERDSGLYLPWWSLVILILVVGGAACGLLVLVANLSGAVLVDQTPQVVIITSAVQVQPTSASGASQPPTGIASVEPSLEPNLPTPQPSRTAVPGGCLLNEEVLVRGTEGVGLNLRDRPGGEVAFIAKEGERMIVIDGPQVFNDIEWCQVRSIAQSSSFGWASKEFLIPTEDDE